MSSIRDVPFINANPSGDEGKGLRSDVVILVMGAIGAGKSYFILKLLSAMGSTRETHVNEGLRTWHNKRKIEPIVLHPLEGYTFSRGYPHLEGIGARIVIVEVPGFDPGETREPLRDSDKLKDLAAWLSDKWFAKGTLTQTNIGGIIYLYDTSQDRASSGMPQRYLDILNNLLPINIPLSSVVLTMTKWRRVDAAVRERREEELNNQYWKSLVEPKQSGKDGATVMKFSAGTEDSDEGDALGVVHLLLNQTDRLVGERFLATCVQARSAIEGKTIRSTDLTKRLRRALEESIRLERVLLTLEEGPQSSEVRMVLAQNLKESIGGLSNLMSQLRTRDAMYLFVLEIYSTFKTIYNRFYL